MIDIQNLKKSLESAIKSKDEAVSIFEEATKGVLKEGTPQQQEMVMEANNIFKDNGVNQLDALTSFIERNKHNM